MSKIRVMIVDDHSLVRQTWEKLLSIQNKFEIIAATGHGQVAIDTAKTEKPELVLLDINMTPVDGFEILKMIRQYSPETKVIAVSLHSKPDIINRMMESGARGYISKIASTESMINAIDEVLAGETYVWDPEKDADT